MEYEIHSFGYGSDHDEEWLTTISDFKNGKYYYIRNNSYVDQSLLDTLGSLLAVVGTNAKIEVELADRVYFEKFYGEFWEDDRKQRATIDVGNITSDMD